MIDDLLAECAAEGYILSYCFQNPPTWRVVLHKLLPEGRLCQMSEAPTFALALESCMAAMGNAELVEDGAGVSYSIDNSSAPNLAQLVLALNTPAQKVRRI